MINERQAPLPAGRDASTAAFSEALAHDLKKPLSVIKTVTGLLSSGNLGVLNAQGLEALKTCGEAVAYMQSMLDDFLTCSRLESGAGGLEREAVDFRDVLAQVLETLKFQTLEKKAAVSAVGEGRVFADRRGLTQVFINLIGNAVHYIGEGPGRAIGINGRKEGGVWTFCVRDNGIGIPEEDQAHIFEKFRRGRNVLGLSGTGLGLSIVKAAVEAHGGKIWFTSAAGKGTAFYFTLPEPPDR